MTDDWREELIEKMVDDIAVACGYRMTTRNGDRATKQILDAHARAALAVAEPVIREQADAVLREENARLREILNECADDLEDAVNAQYGEMSRKVMPDRYERDMQSVVKARKAIREGGET